MVESITEYNWPNKPEGFKYIGMRNTLNKDALGIVTGSMQFVQDMEMPNMLYGRMKTSTVAHARIRSIDTSEAKAMPGVRAVITSDDVADVRMFGDEPIMARGKVLYHGEPVALVAAETPEIAEAALEKIKVDYEELPIALDVEKQASENPIPIHEPKLLASRFYDERPQLINATIGRHGDIEAGFAEADAVVEQKFEVNRVTHMTAGPNCALTYIDDDGRIVGIEESQSMWQVHYPVFAAVMNVPMSKARFKVPRKIAGAYGNRSYLHVASRCGWLTLKTGRPVKLQFTRDECVTITSRPRWIFYTKFGCKSDGNLTAGQFTVYEANGAYGRFGGSIVRNAIFQFEQWRLPAFNYDSFAAYTNEVPMQNMHTFAHQEVCFAIGQVMDMLAEKIGMDKLEFKRMNLLVNGEVDVLDELINGNGAAQALVRAGELLGWGTPKAAASGPWKRGRAADVGNVYINPLIEKPLTHVRLNANPGVEIFASVHDLGTQINTTMAYIAADVCNIPADNCVVTELDTDHTPFTGSAYANQQAYVAGGSLKKACEDALNKMFTAAAPILGANPEDLDTKDGLIFVKGTPETSIPWAQAMKGTQPFIVGTGETWLPLDSENIADMKCQGYACPIEVDPSGMLHFRRLNMLYMHTGTAIELSVNTDTGEVKIEKVANVSDCRPLNVWACDQQYEMTNNYMGCGLYTEMIQDQSNGLYLNTSHLEYKWPGSLDVPCEPGGTDVDHVGNPGRVECTGIEEPWPDVWGVYGGGKGLSESTIVNCQSVIANAITDALGIRFNKAPITRGDILKALGKA
jgi:xanthine dehydrogenase molybdenum-binding subunit